MKVALAEVILLCIAATSAFTTGGLVEAAARNGQPTNSTITASD